MTDSASRERLALRIVRRLNDSGFRALYAGGYVRDRLLGLSSGSDIDIATGATPETVARLFGHTVGVGAHFGVVIVVEDGVPFEVATFRSDIGVKDGRHPAGVAFADERVDAQRRDFTINGMFFDPLTGDILDYVDGKADLQRNIIRAIGEPRLRFSEDYLRMLRAVRFAARFEFIVETGTLAAIRELAPNITAISAERIFQELDKMLHGPHPDRAVTQLHETGLLRQVLPEVSAMDGVAQPPEFHPEGDVLRHTVLALGHLSHPSQVLAWSVLLHDIGKPSTFQVSDRIRFNNHDTAGERMAGVVLERLRAPRALIESVQACIGNHMHFAHVEQMRMSTLKRFLARDTIEDELELHRVDCLASHGKLDNYELLLGKRAEFAAERLKPAPLIGGRDLLALGYAPGPRLGKILDEVYDLQLDEKIRTRDEALDWVRANNP